MIFGVHILRKSFSDEDLLNAGLKKYFKCIIDSETVGVKKPHSKIFNTAFNRSGAKKLEECSYTSFVLSKLLPKASQLGI